ncbi:hypothetical protein SETIT_2G428700v2 [Setaria italica]|uniref:Uncharacterized protein n=1 Tax=Setaria italica TaxID=4555 RepID=A0A368QB23_SETIT|nr:hypothetical protein SETIT_2G428700v2 [Setaria italica]
MTGGPSRRGDNGGRRRRLTLALRPSAAAGLPAGIEESQVWMPPLQIPTGVKEIRSWGVDVECSTRARRRRETGVFVGDDTRRRSLFFLLSGPAGRGAKRWLSLLAAGGGVEFG